MKKIENLINNINNCTLNIDMLSFFTLAITCIYLTVKYFYCIGMSIVGNNSLDLDLYLIICTIINLIVIVYRIRGKELKLKSIDYVFLLLNILYIVSAIVNPNGNSLFGKLGRYEGLTSLILYATIYFNARCIKDKKYIKKLISLILSIGLINVLIGFIQTYANIANIAVYKHMAFGFIDNPNMYGLFMVMELFLSFGLFLKEENKKYLVYTLLFYIGILLSDSFMPFATMGLLLFITLIYYLVKKMNIKKLIVLFACMLILFPIIEISIVKVNTIYYGDYIKNTYLIDDIGSFVGKVLPIKITTNENKNGISNGRLEIWKLVIGNSKDHVLFGVGPDNLFIYVIGDTQMYDKAHNHYLEVYATSGIFAAIAYISFVVLAFARSNKKSYISVALLLAFTAYSIDIFGSISVPFAAIYYYLVIGLLMSIKDNNMEY